MSTDSKASPVFIIINFPNDNCAKTFSASSKAVFPQNHIFCPFRAACELSAKSKPPLIKSTDVTSLSTQNVLTVINHWINNLLKKPPQKASSPKKASKKGSKAPTPPQSAAEAQNEQKPDENSPNFIYISDYPRTFEQMKGLISSGNAPICFIEVEGEVVEQQQQQPTTTQSPTKRRSNHDQVQQIALPFISADEWRAKFSYDIPFIKIDVEQNPEEVCKQLCKTMSSIYNGLLVYRSEFVNYRFISIPKFPPEETPLPIIASNEKVVNQQKEKPTKGAHNAQPVQQEPPKPPLDLKVRLREAYKKTLAIQLGKFLQHSSKPLFSNNFQHAAELLPNYPLPASLAMILSKTADQRAPEIFTMRSLAYRTKTSLSLIMDTMIIQQFEKMIGYSVGERRHVEMIPLDFVPNVLSPLLSNFSRYDSCEYAGKILLAFFNEMPSELPTLNISEKFGLPCIKGFGKWIENRENSFENKPEEQAKDNDEDGNSVGINVGGNDIFEGFDSNETIDSKVNYFGESGLCVQTFPTSIENGLIKSMNFNVQFLSSTRFSFRIWQTANENKSDGSEEEDEAVKTFVQMRGVLGNLDCFLDHQSSQTSLILKYKNAIFEFDITNGRTIISGVKGESKRIMTFKGDIIKYENIPIIYKTDGSIQKYEKGEWHLIDPHGNAFIKKNGLWLKDPDNNQSSELAQTFFTPRKVTNYSHGLSFIEDGEDLTISFPDGTKFIQKEMIYTHPELPNIKLQEGVLTIDTNEFTASLSEGRDCTIDMKNNSVSFIFNESTSHIQIQYGAFKNDMTLIDLCTGMVANVDSRKGVYYLNDEFEWQVGKHNCSKRDILQHFKDNDFIETITPADEMKEDLESIITNGHRPRLFLIEKEQSSLAVKELLAAPDFQSIMEQSTSRISKKDDSNVTLWFDTEPKSYREILITPKITNEQKNQIYQSMEEQVAIEEERIRVLNTVSDPKWRELEDEQAKEENDIQELLKKYSSPAQETEEAQ